MPTTESACCYALEPRRLRKLSTSCGFSLQTALEYAILVAMTLQQPHNPLHLAGLLEDGRHSSDALSAAVRQGRMLRVRRGVYVQTNLWVQCQPSERYRLTIAAASLQNPGTVLCRQTALAAHGLPLLSVAQLIHLRVHHRSTARRSAQTPTTGSLSPAEFLQRAMMAGLVEGSGISPRVLRGFDTARHVPMPASVGNETLRLQLPTGARANGTPAEVAVQAEHLDAALVDTLPRLPFADAVTVLDAALRGTSSRPAVETAHLEHAADQYVTSQRKRRYLHTLLGFCSPLSESPGESLARVRFHELSFAPPTLQVSLRVDGRTYRLDFCWDEVGVVVEFDGWMKYRQAGANFDQTRKQEKMREDAIRSTGRTVVRIYWEDLMEPGCRRLVSLLDRTGVPRIR